MPQYPVIAESLPVADQSWEPDLNLACEALHCSLDGYPDQVQMQLHILPVRHLEDVGRAHCHSQYATSISEGHQTIGNAQISTPLVMIGSASEVEQITVPPYNPSTYKRTEEPSRNAEGRITCRHSECSNLTFTTRSNWK